MSSILTLLCLVDILWTSSVWQISIAACYYGNLVTMELLYSQYIGQWVSDINNDTLYLIVAA